MDSPGSSASPGGAGGSSSGTLRHKLFLGRSGVASFKPLSPFYLMKPDLPSTSALSGGANLLASARLSAPKKMSEDLSAFLPHLPSYTFNAQLHPESSSLKNLIEKPPISQEIVHLPSAALANFRLLPGSIPSSYRVYTGGDDAAKERKKHKRALEESEREESDSEKKKKRRDEPPEKKRKKKEKKKKKKQSPTPA